MKLQQTILSVTLLVVTCGAFVAPQRQFPSFQTVMSMSPDDSNDNSFMTQNARRATIATLVSGIAAIPLAALAETKETEFVQQYSDFEKTSEGWSFRDVKAGKGESPAWGDRVVFDWSGYTIGYFGRPFEARGGPQGGAFDKELDFSRAVLGQNTIVHGLECAFTSMKVGGIRQVIVPYGDELGYPANDIEHKQVGPKPSTFSGQRALNFVLENPRVDRTLLFNIKLVRIDKPTGKGGFARG
jgi:FKBP-type peptidyl-prolyl cis-trans isomerase